MNEAVSQNQEQAGAPDVKRLPLANMGKGGTYIRRMTAHFGKMLEGEVVARCGSVNVAQASRIATARTAARRAMQVERRLAAEGHALSISDWVALSDRSIKYREVIDKCLVSLGLDAEARKPDIWSTIYNAPALQASAPANPEPDNRPESHPAALDAADAKPEALAGIPAIEVTHE